MFAKRVTAAILAASTLAGAASAQETATLKFAHVFPAEHYLWTHGGKVFADAVAEATDGRITFQVFPAAQLGKDYVSLLKSNLAESALLVPSYTPESLSLTSVSELPGLYSTSCEATAKLWEIARPGGVLNEAEYAPQDLQVLFVSTLPPFKLLTASRPVAAIADLAGLKIRANGAAMDKTVRTLGATPVQVTAGELYDSLSRGTVDGGFFPFHPVPSYSLQDVFGYGVEGAQLGSGSVVFAMSERAWSELGTEDQAALSEAAAAAQQNLCRWLDAEEVRVRDLLVAENGLQVTSLSPDQAAAWQAAVAEVATEWAADLDGLGRPGTAVLEAFRNAAP